MEKEVTLQRWTRPGFEEGPVPCATSEELARVIRDIGSAWSALLIIEVGDNTLLVNASQGVYTVTASLGDGDFYDLLGDSAGEGEMQYAQGGQVIGLPRKHAVSVGQAIDAAARFFEQGTVDLHEGVWEKQI